MSNGSEQEKRKHIAGHKSFTLIETRSACIIYAFGLQ